MAGGSWWRRWLAVLGLLALSGLCAETLSGYDDTTGRPLAIIGGLLFVGPLYGVPALVIRELTVRRGLGWSSRALAAAGFGLLQAGVIDQSIFARHYRDIASWGELIGPTWIEPLGLAAYTTMIFVGGHIVFSFLAPIALVEGLLGGLSGRAWVGRAGLGALGVAWLLVALMIWYDHHSHGYSEASPWQLAGAASVVAILLGVGLGRRRRPSLDAESARRLPWRALVPAGLTGLAAGGLLDLCPPTWWGVGVMAVGLAVCAVAARHQLRRWTPTAAVAAAVAFGVTLERAVVSFASSPVVGSVDSARALGHHVVMLVLVVVVGVTALWRNGARSAAGSAGSGARRS